MEKFYITTAIDYVNSLPHIGTAYEKIGADAIARYMRFRGMDVKFQMGNDEHSVNVKKAAVKEGLHPKEYCDKMEEKFVDVWRSLNISYTGFIRTSEERHKTSVQELFKKIYEAGDIYKSKYTGWYCESCEAFLMEKDLENGECPNHKKKPVWLEEENYFFALSKYAGRLLDHINKHPEFILPEVRRNEVIKMIEMGLSDISVSRSSFDWGIPVPWDPSHVVYVWFDALVNYITAAGYPNDASEFGKWWPADMHVIGKDIIRFHCVIWPAMLMSAGIPLPKTIFAHGFVYLKGEKMSKSLGNVVTPLDVVATYGADSLRYFLLREVPFGKDADFTWDAFINRYNGDLANGIGNLVSRTAGMMQQYFGGKIERPIKENEVELDARLREKVLATSKLVDEAMTPRDVGIQTNVALAAIWDAIASTDKYINENKPWELARSGNKERIQHVIYNVLESIRIVAVLLYPFLPETAAAIWQRFGFESTKKLEDASLDDITRWGVLSVSYVSHSDGALFPRIDNIKAAKDTRVKKEEKMDELVDISDFSKIDLRIAEVKSAEKVEGADKLLRLTISLGDEERVIVAGIAKAYTPEALIGKKIVVVANLKPAKIRGIESKGMLLAASAGDEISILTPLKDIPAGSKVK